MTRRVRLRIDRLVLDEAFAHLNREALGAAVEAELGRLLAEEGAADRLGGRPGGVGRVDGGSFEIAAGARAQEVGEAIARRILGGIGDGVGGPDAAGDHRRGER